VEAGIPLGVTFSFLIAGPMINEVAAIILVGIAGWELAARYVVAGLLVAWFVGIVMQAFRPERWVEDYVGKVRMGQATAAERDNSILARQRYAVAEVRKIFGRIWTWVLIGIGVGALFHGFVPEYWVTEHLGGDVRYTVPAAVLLGVPLSSGAAKGGLQIPSISEKRNREAGPGFRAFCNGETRSDKTEKPRKSCYWPNKSEAAVRCQKRSP